MIKIKNKKSSKEPIKYLIIVISILIAYFITGKFGLSLAFVHPNSTAVWAPTGIAIAVMLLFGYRVWPAIFIGAFLVNFTTAGTILTSLGIALGNTLEGLIGATLINKYANGTRVFNAPKTIILFVIFATAGAIVSGTIGIASLSLGGFASWEKYLPIWLTWWTGNLIGALIVTPLIVVWSGKKSLLDFKRAAFSVLLYVIVSLIVFHPFVKINSNYPLAFLFILPVLYISYKFGQRSTTASMLFLTIITILGTVNGFGPFGQLSTNESLLVSQAYLGVISLTGLTISSLVLKNEKHK